MSSLFADAPQRGTQSPRVLVVTALAILATLVYLTWGFVGMPGRPWLATPYFALELIGLVQLALLIHQSWQAPPRRQRSPDHANVVDLVVTCTFHTAEQLEHTLIGARTVHGIRRTIVVTRPGRDDLEQVAARFDATVIERAGNHVNGFWSGCALSGAPFVAWLEAGQVPMPDFVQSSLEYLTDPLTAVVQAGVGLLNKDSFAHLRGGRDEDALRHSVVYPALGSRGLAPWIGGGSIVRTIAMSSVGTVDVGDQAALSRAVVRIQTDGWNTRFHSEPSLVRDTAPDTLGAYLMLRRRRAIESMRVFRTPENPLWCRGLDARQRTAHIGLAFPYLISIRQLGLMLILIATLVSGTLPFGGGVLTWFAFWSPAFVLGLAARRLLSRGTMRLGDWTRQGWRTLTADLSAVATITGLRRTHATFYDSSGSGLHAFGKLRLLTVLLLTLDVAIVLRGLTLVSPRMLPRFTTSGRVLVLGVSLIALASVIDVLQVAVRRSQRRKHFRLKTNISAVLDGVPVIAADIAPGGFGCHMAKDERPPPVDAVARATLAMPIAGGVEPLHANGIVRSVVDMGDRWRVGIQFTELDEEAKMTLIAYCAIHHHLGELAAVHQSEPAQFDVGSTRPKLAQTASVTAIFVGLVAAFLGPAAPKAFADAAAPASVCLQSSTGEPVAGGVVRFMYDDAWDDFGTTTEDGCLENLLPAMRTRVEVVHRGTRAQRTQNLAENPTVVFTTAPLVVEFTSSVGEPIAGVPVEFQAGEWRDLGTTDEAGQVIAELLPKKRKVAVTHEGIRMVQTFDHRWISAAPFSTVPATVRFTTSQGDAIAGVEATFRVGGEWLPFGITDDDGLVTRELLPSRVRFALRHEGIRSTVDQNLDVHPVAEFKTVPIFVGLRDSSGGPLANGLVEYRAGQWIELGSTDDDGTLTAELLPTDLRIAVSLDGIRNKRDHDIRTSPSIEFRTVAVTATLHDSTSRPLEGGVVEYRAGQWRAFGTTDASGSVTTELLPDDDLRFSVRYDGLRERREQDTYVDPLVEFATVPVTVTVIDELGSPVPGVLAEYNANGWKEIGVTDASGAATVELLADTRNFRITHDEGREKIRANLAESPAISFVIGGDGTEITVDNQDEVDPDAEGAPEDSGVERGELTIEAEVPADDVEIQESDPDESPEPSTEDELTADDSLPQSPIPATEDGEEPTTPSTPDDTGPSTEPVTGDDPGVTNSNPPQTIDAPVAGPVNNDELTTDPVAALGGADDQSGEVTPTTPTPSSPATSTPSTTPRAEAESQTADSDVPTTEPPSTIPVEAVTAVASAALTSNFAWSTPDDVATEVLDMTLQRASVSTQRAETSTVEYEFRIENTTDTVLAAGAVVEVEMSGATQLAPVDSGDWSCVADITVWRCRHAGPLHAGSSSTIKLTAAVPAVGLLDVHGGSSPFDFVILIAASLLLFSVIMAGVRVTSAAVGSRSRLLA